MFLRLNFETGQRIRRLIPAILQITNEFLLGTGQFDSGQFECFVLQLRRACEQLERLHSFHLGLNAIPDHSGQVGQQSAEPVRHVPVAGGFRAALRWDAGEALAASTGDSRCAWATGRSSSSNGSGARGRRMCGRRRTGPDECTNASSSLADTPVRASPSVYDPRRFSGFLAAARSSSSTSHLGPPSPALQVEEDRCGQPAILRSCLWLRRSAASRALSLHDSYCGIDCASLDGSIREYQS